MSDFKAKETASHRQSAATTSSSAVGRILVVDDVVDTFVKVCPEERLPRFQPGGAKLDG